MRHWGSNLKAGDVLLSNHPQLAGGRYVVAFGHWQLALAFGLWALLVAGAPFFVSVMSSWLCPVCTGPVFALARALMPAKWVVVPVGGGWFLV